MIIGILKETQKHEQRVSATPTTVKQLIKSEHSVIIEKNTPRPCSVTKSFYTVYEGQEGIDCVITSSSSNETDPKFGNYYEMIEFNANVRVSKNDTQYGFYENPSVPTLQRFEEW